MLYEDRFANGSLGEPAAFADSRQERPFPTPLETDPSPFWNHSGFDVRREAERVLPEHELTAPSSNTCQYRAPAREGEMAPMRDAAQLVDEDEFEDCEDSEESEKDLPLPRTDPLTDVARDAAFQKRPPRRQRAFFQSPRFFERTVSRSLESKGFWTTTFERVFSTDLWTHGPLLSRECRFWRSLHRSPNRPLW